jgi:hypothetical protein
MRLYLELLYNACLPNTEFEINLLVADLTNYSNLTAPHKLSLNLAFTKDTKYNAPGHFIVKTYSIYT